MRLAVTGSAENATLVSLVGDAIGEGAAWKNVEIVFSTVRARGTALAGGGVRDRGAHRAPGPRGVSAFSPRLCFRSHWPWLARRVLRVAFGYPVRGEVRNLSF